MNAEAAWHDLVEKDDRTSPEDYPEMALISFEELKAYMSEQDRLLAAIERVRTGIVIEDAAVATQILRDAGIA